MARLFRKRRRTRRRDLPPPPVPVEERRGFANDKDAYADIAQLAGPDTTVVFDVGANIGNMTQRFLDRFPRATVQAFEPFPECFCALQERFRETPRVQPHPLALADTPGRRQLHTFSTSVVNSLLPLSPASAQFVEGEVHREGGVEVDTTTLDLFCTERGIAHIDVLKMDVQGAELKVLKGATRLLDERRIGLLYAEVAFVSVYEDQAWYHELATFLSDRGYALFDFYNFAYTEDGRLKWGDAIFLPATSGEAAPNGRSAD